MKKNNNRLFIYLASRQLWELWEYLRKVLTDDFTPRFLLYRTIE